MTALDEKFVPLALKLVTKFGITATLFTYSGGYTPSSGSNARTETPTSVTATPPQKVRQELASKEIKVSDSFTYLAASGLTVTPARDSKITLSGQKWHVVRVDPLISGDSTAAYRLFLRGE